MMIEKYLKDVIEFRTTFNLPVGFGSPFDRELHYSLVVEELTELADARNLVDVADALVDTAYVLIGRLANAEFTNDGEVFMVNLLMSVADAKGIDFDACWDEIHSSNMSKVCKSLKETDLTRDYYAAKGISTTVEKSGQYYVVKACTDAAGVIKRGKVLKSINYRPADLAKVMMK